MPHTPRAGTDSRRRSVPQASSAFVAHPELINELEKRASPVAFGSDRVLFRQGDLPIGIYILRKGKARLTSQSDGDAIQTIEAGVGSLFGLSAVIGNKPYSLSAEALEGAELSLLTCEDFIQLMQTEPSMSFRVLEVLAEELRFARETLAHLKLPLPGDDILH
jgi:CRP/FNR family transcriptional regulator, polysaccharide utilization system transcription regulator